MPDDSIVEALRTGDESAFLCLVNHYHTPLVRIANLYVHDLAVAEEIAQDTWLGVLKGIERFEGRSSLKTWIFQIMTNIARTRWDRENRSISFSMLANTDSLEDEPVVDPDRFFPMDHHRWPGHWSEPPKPWKMTPEEHFLQQEVLCYIRKEIASLPDRQRIIIELRDMIGWSSEEVCNVFNLTKTNQRVLLHRARSKVRRALEKYFE
jgi:RNA polymerase sigma-70 factor (ECF subfamily)